MSTRILRGVAALGAVLVLSVAAPGTAGAANVDRTLLDMYQPVTYLDPVEQFGPASVQSFVADADLEQFNTGSWVLVDAESRARPAARSRHRRVASEPGLMHSHGGARRARVLRGCGATREPEPASCTDTLHGFTGAIVLEYWFFYYDDVYSYTYPPSDFIWQAHEGDWEAVNVVLSEDEQPQFVGYSQHCLGQRRAWSSTPLLGTHPIVYVAIGSHANYFAAGIHPINVQCIPPPAIAFLQAVHLRFRPTTSLMAAKWPGRVKQAARSPTSV